MYKYKIDVIKALSQAGYTYYKCRKEGILSQGTLHKLRSCGNVTLETLDRVCQLLHCQLSDIIEIVPDAEPDLKNNR